MKTTNCEHFEAEKLKNKNTEITMIYISFIKIYLKLVSAIFYQVFIFHQVIALSKLKMIFISSKKLFSFSRYSDFCYFFPSSPQFPDSKGQMEVE